MGHGFEYQKLTASQFLKS